MPQITAESYCPPFVNLLHPIVILSQFFHPRSPLISSFQTESNVTLHQVCIIFACYETVDNTITAAASTWFENWEVVSPGLKTEGRES